MLCKDGGCKDDGSPSGVSGDGGAVHKIIAEHASNTKACEVDNRGNRGWRTEVMER